MLHSTRRSKELRAVVAFLYLALTASPRAQESAVTDVERELQEVRELIRAGEHEAAIEAAKSAKASVESTSDTMRLGQAYLLLVLSYVNYANFQENVRRPMSAEILNKEAAALIRECLEQPELRYTQPDPASGEFPPEMIEMFRRIRAEMFGALRIIALDPPDARVALDGAQLTRLPGEEALGDAAVLAGVHTLTIEREGYEPLTETLTITPNSWQERPYQLEKKRGKGFYTAVGAGILAVVGGVVALVAWSAGGDEQPVTQQPLPEPPQPPSR